MTTKMKVSASVVALLTAFAFGRWACPTKIKTEIKTVEVEKKTDKTVTDLDLNKHKETTTTEIKRPDGTVEKTTKVVEDSQGTKKTDQRDTDQIAKTDSQSKEVTYSSAKVTISALAGFSLSNATPVYGMSVTKPILGSIVVGCWGLTDKSAGVSVGLTF